MRNAIRLIGAAAYGTAVSLALSLALGLYSPWAHRYLSSGWGALAVSLLFGFAVGAAISALVGKWTAVPIRRMCGGRHWSLMLVPTLALAVSCALSSALPWRPAPHGGKAVAASLYLTAQFVTAHAVIAGMWWSGRAKKG